MMLAPKNGYTKAICIKSFEFHDKVWGNCSVIEGQSYELLTNTLDDKYVLVKIRNGLCPHYRVNFKTTLDIREDKLNTLI